MKHKILSKSLCKIVGFAYEKAFNLDFPDVVRIETTNACNAKCIICPHPSMSRPVKRIEDEMFYRIIDECSSHGCKEVHLHNFGEPLLDKRLEVFVTYAKNKGIKKVKIFSNGSILSEKRAVGLIEAGLDEIKISFDGANKEEFERIRVPLKFDAVIDNILTLVKLRDEAQSSLKIKVNCCSTTDKSKTMDFLKEKVDKFSFSKIHNWGGDDGDDISDSNIRKPCSRLWRTFTILADGYVSLCCLDYDGKEKLGNLNNKEESIKSIWHNDRYKHVRILHGAARQNEIDLCKSCSKSFV